MKILGLTIIPLILMLQFLPAPARFVPQEWKNQYSNARKWARIISNMYESAPGQDASRAPLPARQTEPMPMIASLAAPALVLPVLVEFPEEQIMVETGLPDASKLLIDEHGFQKNLKTAMECRKIEIQFQMQELRKLEKKMRVVKLQSIRRTA